MLSNLATAWRALAEQLRPYAPPAAEAWGRAADELEAALRASADEELTLAEAARESGFADRTLREKLAKGEIPNVGRKHAPRIRRGDLPRRARANSGGFDAAAEARLIRGGA